MPDDPSPGRRPRLVLSRYDVRPVELEDLLAGEPRYRAEQVRVGLWRDGLDPADITTLPTDLRERLTELLPPALHPVGEEVGEGGDTVKWLHRLHDGALIETVLMHYETRSTVCVSTQAGCAMGCGFCATGQQGLDRNLTSGEIVEQVMRARRRSAPRRVSNVVFMGMGEPLANYERVWQAVESLHGDVGLSARHLTLSTVGLVPGIRRLTAEDLPVGLAVSLHAARDELRDELVPVNRRHRLAELLEACHEHRAAGGRRLSFEWALIAGVNDQARDTRELAAIARALGAHVNLIPLNPTEGFAVRGSDAHRVRWFRDELARQGTTVTIRRNRGTDIDAACGQLRARAGSGDGRGERSVAVTLTR